MSPRLFFQVATMEARRMMSYRADFWINVIMGFAIQIGVLYFLVHAIFSEAGTETIGGYDFHGMLYYYVLLTVLSGVIRGSDFAATSISAEIYSGELTRFIIYPARYFPYKYAQHLGMSLPGLVQAFGFGLLCFLAFRLPAEMAPTPGRILMGATAVLMANLMNFIIYLPIQGVAFWQDNVWSLAVMMRFLISIFGGGMIPLTLFPDWAQATLKVLPFGCVFSFPVNAMMGRLTWEEWLAGIVVCAFWCLVGAALTQAVWKRGRLQYAGVGI